jgi:uncharacterized protein YdeI (YjbR/CyaY-like superfamily)
MPLEILTVFEQIPEAKIQFDLLSDGKKRFALMHVNNVKSLQLRADRAVSIAQNLINCSNPKISFADLVKK